MLFLKYLLLWGGIGMIVAAIAILARDLYFEMKYRQSLAAVAVPPDARRGDRGLTCTARETRLILGKGGW